MRKPKSTRTLLVDGNVLMKRSYNGAKNLYYKGVHIGGIYQFYTTLRRLIIELKVHYVFISWDGERGGTLRLDYYPEYKGNRPQYFDKDFELQKLRAKQYAEELFIKQFEHPDCESDDVIAYYCQNKKANEKIIIYTNDRDLCQLVSEDISIYLSDKKVEVTTDNYNQYFKHFYKNAGLVKIIEGCSSDNIKGIDGVKETTLLKFFPEISERQVILSEVKEKAKELLEEKTYKALTNIVNGVSSGCHRGEFYEINDKIINLNNPLLTDEAIDELQLLIQSPLDPEGRSTKNLLKMMIEDGVMYSIPGGESGYIKYMEPFVKISKREKKKYNLKN